MAPMYLQTDQMQFNSTGQTKAGHRIGLYRYHSGSFRSGSIRDGTGHRESVHGKERYHNLIPVYRYQYILIYSGSVPVRSGSN
ncbi:hypothetical protein H5410_040394 [Solanum commersonii]|uniref:Uncharacterized protein n=1 Tax=Solanum commersonii TaxID=4109 RepID=A0A9J5XRW7_SOLCO|nr:hypothetical protein H5410_040394 [Solanum commersonii]